MFVAKAIVGQCTGWYSILSGDEGLHSGQLCVLLAFCYTQYMRTQLEQRALVILIPIEHQGAPTYCSLALYLPTTPIPLHLLTTVVFVLLKQVWELTLILSCPDVASH